MKNKTKQSGQAMLAVVGLLSVGLLMASTNIMIGIIEHDQALSFQQSDQGTFLAEAGAEEAIIRLIRDPNYQGGQLVIDEENVNIEIDDIEGGKSIVSTVNRFGKKKAVSVQLRLGEESATVTGWRDI